GCQIKGSEVCNMTIQSVLNQFPSLQGCVCDWQEELCGSIQALIQNSSHANVICLQNSPTPLLFIAYDGAGSCLNQITVCVSDTVCNRYLAPVLQACMGDQCNRDHCQQVTQQFYGSMPHNVAEMLVMCECEASDQSCLDMKTTLQNGMCGDETQLCQETVKQCVKDSNCRYRLKTFQDKCWSFEEAKCSDSELVNTDCLTLMDPAFILGADPECEKAFLASLGTALHYPCSCKGLHTGLFLDSQKNLFDFTLTLRFLYVIICPFVLRVYWRSRRWQKKKKRQLQQYEA
uniref:GDNF/GAS1 domain-containing protein n=1 Tax=Anabas testudineus TaxID=64144 RepID=A0A7N6AMR9_ANATE